MPRCRSTLLLCATLSAGLAGCDDNPLLGKWEMLEDETRLQCLVSDYAEFTEGTLRINGQAFAVSYARDGSDRIVKRVDGSVLVVKVTGDRMDLNGCPLRRYDENAPHPTAMERLARFEERRRTRFNEQ